MAEFNGISLAGQLTCSKASLFICSFICEQREASDDLEALQKTLALRPDLVLPDLSMPGRNGLETTRLLREEFLEIKILIMSDHDPSQLLATALEAGANGCLDKGWIGTDLRKAIKNCLISSQIRTPNVTV